MIVLRAGVLALMAAVYGGAQAADAAAPVAVAAPAVAASAPAAVSVESLLTALEGPWTMTGDVRGKPVQYRMTASRTLAGKFIELHMVDVQVPPKYEARVFIGADKTGKLFVHWLDAFGPEYSVPHAEGSASGNTLVFQFPYKSGLFRDTLTYEPASNTWTFNIDAQKPDNTWQHFAAYQLSRE